MTNAADLNRLCARIANAATIFEARLPYATDNLALHAADGHPNTASGNTNNGTRSTAELTPTEAAAHTNLGGLYTYPCTDPPCTEPTHIDPDTGRHTLGQQPGPAVRLDDIADELRAALTSLDRAHRALTDCGVPPFVTSRYLCHGINGRGCEDWADCDPDTGIPRRSDHLCIDCGRIVDRKRRAYRTEQERRRYHTP